MKTIIYGAGAMGCYFGARLQQSGHDVTYIARGPHLEAMQQNGLRIESRSGGFHLNEVCARRDTSGLDCADLILFAVKNYDVADCLPEMSGIVGPDTAIITVQNGVSAQPMLADAFGADRVLPGVVRLPADIREPGVIRTPAEEEMTGITFGPYAGGSSPAADAIHRALIPSGIPVVLSDDIWRALWEKFIPLSAFSAMTVSTRLDIGHIRRTENSRALLRALIDETASIARAAHDTVPADAGQTAFDFLMQVPPDIHASMLDDLERGKRIELDWLSGEVIRRGRALGIPTPSHECIYAVLAPFIDGRPEDADN